MINLLELWAVLDFHPTQSQCSIVTHLFQDEHIHQLFPMWPTVPLHYRIWLPSPNVSLMNESAAYKSSANRTKWTAQHQWCWFTLLTQSRCSSLSPQPCFNFIWVLQWNFIAISEFFGAYATNRWSLSCCKGNYSIWLLKSMFTSRNSFPIPIISI